MKGTSASIFLALAGFILLICLLVLSLGGSESITDSAIDIPLHESYLVVSKWQIALAISCVGLLFVLVVIYQMGAKARISWRKIFLLLTIWFCFSGFLAAYSLLLHQTGFYGWNVHPPRMGYYPGDFESSRTNYSSLLLLGFVLVDVLFLGMILILLRPFLSKTKMRGQN
jgi:hypothetical protein